MKLHEIAELRWKLNQENRDDIKSVYFNLKKHRGWVYFFDPYGKLREKWIGADDDMSRVTQMLSLEELISDDWEIMEEDK